MVGFSSQADQLNEEMEMRRWEAWCVCVCVLHYISMHFSPLSTGFFFFFLNKLLLAQQIDLIDFPNPKIMSSLYYSWSKMLVEVGIYTSQFKRNMSASNHMAAVQYIQFCRSMPSASVNIHISLRVLIMVWLLASDESDLSISVLISWEFLSV